MLNEMSAKDPSEYQRFVSDQIESYKEHEKRSLEGKATDEDNIRHFRPNAGFVFQTKTKGGDGIKIRDSVDSGKILYINVCSYEGLKKPPVLPLIFVYYIYFHRFNLLQLHK